MEVNGGRGAAAAFSQGGYRFHPLRRELDGPQVRTWADGPGGFAPIT